jgi:hypothetical protein
MIKAKKTKNEIDSVKELQQMALDTLFTKQEKFNFYTSKKSATKSSPIPYSQISLVIKWKDSIGLSQSVITSLLSKVDTLKKMKDDYYVANSGKQFDSRPFESETLGNILSENQYTKFLNIKNSYKAKNYANTDWKELETRGLTNGHNKDSALNQLTAYYLARQNVYDRYANDKIQMNANLAIVNDNKPAPLKALIHARRNPSNGTIGQSYQW